jgi:hypothetical protein
MGFPPDLPDFKGDGFRRSQLSRLGKNFAYVETHTRRARIVETSIEDSNLARQKMVGSLPLGHRDHGTEPFACPLWRSPEANEVGSSCG